MKEEPIDLSKKSTTELSTMWLHHKQAEETANILRALIEKEIYARLETQQERIGTVTYEVGNADIKIKRDINWSVTDPEQLEMLFIESNIIPFTKKISISDSKMRQLEAHNPKLYKQACRYLSAKPAKPYFQITLFED